MPASRAPRTALLWAVTALGAAWVAWTMSQVARRTLFPYDLVVWADDYVLTELLKLRIGAPLYGPLADASSFIYSPGLPLLHYALLRPFELDVSVVANRVLSQAWLGLAVVFGVLTARALVDRAPAAHRRLALAAAAFALVLAGYSNLVADSLHPGNLELLALTLGALAAARWATLSPRARVLAVTLLPAAGFLAKQAGGSLGIALAVVAWMGPGSRRTRGILAALALGSLAATIGALQAATHGGFGRWGFVVPTRQPFEWSKASFAATWLAFVIPLAVLFVAAARRAIRERRAPLGEAWLRASVILLAYVPFGLLGFFKSLGGPNNFSAPIFLATVLVLPLAHDALLSVSRDAAVLVVGGLACAQIALFFPHRRVPNDADRASARDLCAEISARMRCGERVLVDYGAACLADGGIGQELLDRGNSLLELRFAGLDGEAGTEARVRAQAWDVVAYHVRPRPYFPPEVIRALDERYQAYRLVPEGQLGGSLWVDGWQDLPVLTVFLERRAEAGRHRQDSTQLCHGRISLP